MAVFHDGLVDLTVLDVFGTLEPVLNIGNGNSNVLAVELELRVVRNGLSIVNIWVVNKVPVGLILSSSHSDVVSKSGALDERIVLFLFSKIRVSFLEGVQDLVSSFESVGVLL